MQCLAAVPEIGYSTIEDASEPRLMGCDPTPTTDAFSHVIWNLLSLPDGAVYNTKALKTELGKWNREFAGGDQQDTLVITSDPIPIPISKPSPLVCRLSPNNNMCAMQECLHYLRCGLDSESMMSRGQPHALSRLTRGSLRSTRVWRCRQCSSEGKVSLPEEEILDGLSLPMKCEDGATTTLLRCLESYTDPCDLSGANAVRCEIWYVNPSQQPSSSPSPSPSLIFLDASVDPKTRLAVSQPNFPRHQPS